MMMQRFPWSRTRGESSTVAAGRFWKLLALLCLCLHCRAVKCHSWFRVPNPHNVSLEHRPTLDIQSECPSIKIAVINGVNFHFEVLASVFTVLMPYAQYVDVFLSPYAQTANFNGAWDLVHWFPATYKKAIPSAVVYGYDMVFLISTDYEMQTNTDLVELMKPQLLLAYIHNAQFPLSKLLALAPEVKVLTLSPHVADSVRRFSNQTVDWMLPVYPLQPTDDCLTFPKRWVLGLCLRGFALQGKFSNLRRNYTGIWKQMASKLTIMQDPQVGRVFHVNVLGKGEDRLALPQALEMHVNVHRRLLYNQFFNAIAHNVGLIPSLANSKYYTEKFSSTILASLITGTPVLAEEKLMRAYTFLTPDTVYLAREGEPEVDAMLRIATWKADDILKVRLALLMLRERLNQRAGQMMEGYIRQACEHVKQLRPIVAQTGPAT